MIRIDEIYNNIFWPWVNRELYPFRMFYCDPPGSTATDSVFTNGTGDVIEKGFVFFHDQEPLHDDIHATLFKHIKDLSHDIRFNAQCELQSKHKYTIDYLRKYHGSVLPNDEHIVVSEKGEFADEISKKYRMQLHYYFYHGWACMDWYRGYDKTFLIPRARDRQPTKTFISPNRIVAGKRDHRVLFLYNVFKHGLQDNWISAPRVCNYENVDISVIARKYADVYPDIEEVLNAADLPRMFPGEDTQVMSSYCLTNFDECADSLVYVPTETVYFGRRLHLTEKTFRPIALEMPFVLMAPSGSLAYLREYGFKTFADVFDESYDLETDDIRRVERVTELLKYLDRLSVRERQRIHSACLPIVEHNFNHFYNGDFTEVLWAELLEMLNGLRS